MRQASDPIGVFDSGIGGLTVVKEIINTLPNENIIYLGDTARVPYGTRGRAVIKKFALELANYLINKKVKILVVSCNTISATCLKAILEISPVPVIGVVEPAVSLAVKTSQNQKIGVIGTQATVDSRIYEKEIKKLLPNARVYTKPGSLFVPLVEEGLGNHFATWQIAKDYLAGFKSTGIDTLILGCTHFPLLTDVIQDIVGPGVTLVDSAKPTAEALKQKLQELNLLNKDSHHSIKILVTDAPSRVNKVAGNFFGNHLPVKPVKITL